MRLMCFRYSDFTLDYDAELVWSWVQAQAGHIELRGDCIDYFVPESAAAIFHLRYPGLHRHQHLDVIV